MASRGTFSVSPWRKYIAGQLYLPVSCPKSSDKDNRFTVDLIVQCAHWVEPTKVVLCYRCSLSRVHFERERERESIETGLFKSDPSKTEYFVPMHCYHLEHMFFSLMWSKVVKIIYLGCKRKSATWWHWNFSISNFQFASGFLIANTKLPYLMFQ